MHPSGHTNGQPNNPLLIPNYNSQSTWNFPAVQPEQPSGQQGRNVIKLPPMPNTRSSARQRADSFPSNASGSEYHASNASMDVDDNEDGIGEEEQEEPEPKPKAEVVISSRGRKVVKKSYEESASEDIEEPEDLEDDELNLIDAQDDGDAPGEEDDNVPSSRLRRSHRKSKVPNVIMSDDEGGATVGGYQTRSRSKPNAPQTRNGTASSSRRNGSSRSKARSSRRPPPRPQSLRRTRSNTRQEELDGNYEDDGEPSSTGASDADGSAEEEEDPGELEIGGDADADADGDQEEQETDGKPYALRQRQKVNYAIPPPLEEMRAPPPKPRSGGRSGGRYGGRNKPPGWSATGAELSRWMGGGDDSVRIYPATFLTSAYRGVGFGLPIENAAKELWWWRWRVSRHVRRYSRQWWDVTGRSCCCCWHTIEFRQGWRRLYVPSQASRNTCCSYTISPR